MKKLLKNELKNLANRVLQLEEGTDVDQLKHLAADLHEKLAVLSYSQKFSKKETPAPAVMETSAEEKEERFSPDGTQYNPEAITEPNTEKIKDIVAEMPETGELEKNFPKKEQHEDWRNLGVHYDDLPQFEPVKKTDPGAQKTNRPTEKPEEKTTPPASADATHPPDDISFQKKSLNDRLKKGISFGLNDRLAYIKHLFNGSTSDFDRVLSQLNTFQSFADAKRFIETMVKPDYHNWEGEETYEKRFLKALEAKLR